MGLAKDTKKNSKLPQSFSDHEERMERYYRLLAERSREIIISHDINRRMIYVNPVWVEVTGYSFDETLGKLATNFLAPECHKDANERNRRRHTGNDELFTYEMDLLSKAGERIPVEVRSSPARIENGEIQEILLVARDIRERRKVQHALIESENRYRSLFESAPIAIWEEDFSSVKGHLDSLRTKGIKDFETYFTDNPNAVDECVRLARIINVNQAAITMHQAANKDELLRANLEGILTDAAKQVFAQGLLALLNGDMVFSAETTVKKLSGEDLFQSIQWKVLPHCVDTWARVIVSTQDISELKKSEHLLERSEASYRDLFNTIEDAIYIQDKNGRFLDINKGAEKLYGIPREEIIGKTPDFLSAPGKNDLDEVQQKFQAALSGKPQEFEFYGRRNDGEAFPKEVRLYKGNYFGEDVIIALAREITKRKRTEAQLRHQLSELNVLQATAFTCSQATDEDMLIRQITNILGNTLAPDMYGVLLYDSIKQTITPHSSHSRVEKSITKKAGSLPVSVGITGRTVLTGKSNLVDDVHQDPDYIAFTPTTQSEISVPIIVNDNVLGVINLESAKKSHFTKSDERLLAIIAGQMATAIEKLRLLKTEQQRLQIAEMLQKTAAVLTQTLDPKKATELLLEELASVVRFDSASVQLLRDGYLEIIGGRGNLVLEVEKNRRFAFPADNPNTVVIKTGQPLRLPNAPEVYSAFLEMPSIKSWLGIPLVAHKRSIGILTLDSSKFDHFTEEDIRLATALAHHAAIAIENAQLFEAEKKRRKEAETLRETGLAITASLNLDQAIHQILGQLARVLPYDSASVQILVDNSLKIIGGHGWDNPEEVLEARFPVPGDNPNTAVIQEKQVIVLKDAKLEHAPFRMPPHDHINSWMGVPLIIRNKVIGMLAVDSSERNYFTEESTEIAQTFAYQAAIAIENARLFNAEIKRREEAETLRQAAITINSALSLDTVLKNVAEQITTAVKATGCAISSWDKKENIVRTLVDYCAQSPRQSSPTNTTYLLENYPLTKKVLQNKETIILQGNDEDTEENEVALMEKQGISMLLMLPMIAGDKTIGLIELYEEDQKIRDIYSEDEINLVKGLAAHAALAVENARLYNAEQTRRQEAETLRQAAHTISSSLDLQEVLDTILASIKRVIPYDSAAVMLLIEDAVEITSGNNLPNLSEQIGKRFSLDDPLLAQIVKTAHPLILQDAQKSPHFKKWAETDYVHGWMGVPLVVRGKVIGYITLDSRTTGAYQEKHAELAQTFAHQAASAIENARLYQDAWQTAERRAILHRLSQDILRGIQSSEQTHQAIHRATEKLMPCDAFIISLREKNKADDEAVYLIDNRKRYSAKSISKDISIVTLAEKGSFIIKDLDGFDEIKSENSKLREGHFGSKEKVRSMLVSPMYVGSKLIGAISAQSYTPNIYTTEEKILLEMLASHAAAAIENARLFQETERRGKEFAELYEVVQDLVNPQELDVLLTAILQRTTDLLEASSGSVYLYDDRNDELVVEAVYGLQGEHKKRIQHTRLRKDEGMAGHVAESLQPMRIDDYQTWDKKSDRYKGVPFTSVLEVPMIYNGKLIGVLALYEIYPRTRYFTDDDERIMTLLATQLAGAVHSAKQFEEINNRLREFEAIDQISAALRTTESPDEMLPILLDEISRSLNVHVCTIWLSDPNNDEIYKALSRGWIHDSLPNRQKVNEGIIGQIYTGRSHYVAEEIKADPHILSLNKEKIPANWTGAWVPIQSTHTMTGVIGVMAEMPRKFTNTDIQLLTILSEITGNAIYRAKLHLRTQQQVRRLTALRSIDTAISSVFDLKATLRLLIEQTIAQLKVDAANILLITQPTKNLEYFIGEGFRTETFEKSSLRFNSGLPSIAIKKGTMEYISSPAAHENTMRRQGFAEEGFQSYYCIPLIAKGETLGVLEVFHRDAFTVSAEWIDFLQTLGGQAAIAIENNRLVKDLQNSNEELALAYDTTLEGWGKALELRDKETQGHTLSVTELTLKLAREMGIPESELVNIYRGALLHDIGKMGIPDDILHKPGPLTKEEWKIMRQHPQFAYEMLSSITYLAPAVDIPYCHHERWDGSGYPQGLKGEEIPLAARIFSVIDVWDALLTDRPYREAWARDVVLAYINNESGSRFDPKVVEVFKKLVAEA